MSGPDPSSLAVEFLLASRRDGPDAEESAGRLAALTDQQLRSGLRDDPARIAFWLDIYNAAVVRAGHVELTDWRVRWRHFRRPNIVVAGKRLSLDAIEHGLLRRSRWKLGLGYLRNPLPSSFERAHRVRHVDPRIHFALNCGAASCPPIAAYDPEGLEAQLQLATASYLRTETRVDGAVLRVPSLLVWYIGDFGGRGGVRRLLRDAGVDHEGRALRMADYDWSPAPDRWADGD